MKRRILILLCFPVLLQSWCLFAQVPEEDVIYKSDSLRAVRFLENGKNFFNNNNADSARIMFGKSLDLSQRYYYQELEAENYYYLGRINENTADWETSLKYYLLSSKLYTHFEDSLKLADIAGIIALRYFNMGVYNMAHDYAEEEFGLVYSSQSKIQAALLAARSSFLDLEYEKSIIWYNLSYGLAKESGDIETMVRSLYGLSAAKLEQEKMLETRGHLDELLVLQESLNDIRGLADVYNSLGLLDFETGNIDGAINNYLKAADYYTLSGGGIETAYSNLAICYQNKGNTRRTEEYFELALNEATSTNNLSQKARVEHYLAILNFKKGDLYHADYYGLASIESASRAGDQELLQKTYKTYSEILEEGNDFVKALDYFQLHLSLKDSIMMQQRILDQDAEMLNTKMSSSESQIRQTIADDELRDLELRNLRIENENRAADLQLLERENEVTRLERERLEQDIALEKERTASTMQEKEILMLEQERLMQRRDSVLQEIESRRLSEENRGLEYEATLREMDLQKEQDLKKRAFLLAVLAGFTVIIILVSLISARRRNATLLLQKKTIEEKNLTITDSIEYASRIQNAVLPPSGFLAEWDLESFIMFRPKDIVSGDFYWGARSGDLLCFAAADCTGHGVPGAFMSMLGTAFLNEIINSRQFSNAAEILNQLRNEVITSLRQRGVEGEAQDGMDISLCVYNREENILHYAGANNPLYHVRNGSLERLGADKMPIGIHVSLDKPFTNYEISPEKGDTIYLFSDGYADQFGGPDGKKFKYKPFRDMLLDISVLPLAEQRLKVEERFDDWKKDVEQVDDVILIGIKF